MANVAIVITIEEGEITVLIPSNFVPTFDTFRVVRNIKINMKQEIVKSIG